MTFAVMSIFATAQDSTKTILKQMDTSSNFMKVYSDISVKLDALGSSLKVGSKKIYSTLVQQQMVKSIVNLIVIIALFILLPLMMYYFRNLSKSGEFENFTDVLPFILLFINIVLFIYSVVCIQETITGFVNPEYGALKEIVDFIK